MKSIQDYPHEPSVIARGSAVQGLLERTVTRLLMRPIRIRSVTAPMEEFRLIEIEGEALQHCNWSPGDKVQIKLQGGLATRTFTPIDWDQEHGRTKILAYCPQGRGPGGDWARSIAPGDNAWLLGPRRSLALADLEGPIVLFGDETAFGLALAAERMEAATPPRFILEVNTWESTRPLLDALGVQRASIIERWPGDAHLYDVADLIVASDADAGNAANILLTGKAQAIRRVRMTLQALGITGRRVRTKAYWAFGKVGLD